MKVEFFIPLLIILWLPKKITCLPPESRVLDRRSFPDNFVFGTAASAFQHEGATSEGGKSPSMWDYFSHTFPERTNMQNGDVAVDFYHRYKDDIKLMKELDMDAFRFSISWARLIPNSGDMTSKAMAEEEPRSIITTLPHRVIVASTSRQLLAHLTYTQEDDPCWRMHGALSRRGCSIHPNSP